LKRHLPLYEGEVLTGYKCTVRSDIYSLSAVSYRALVGKRPARNQVGAHLACPIMESNKSEALPQALRIGLAQVPNCRFSTVTRVVNPRRLFPLAQR